MKTLHWRGMWSKTFLAAIATRILGWFSYSIWFIMTQQFQIPKYATSHIWRDSSTQPSFETNIWQQKDKLSLKMDSRSAGELGPGPRLAEVYQKGEIQDCKGCGWEELTVFACQKQQQQVRQVGKGPAAASAKTFGCGGRLCPQWERDSEYKLFLELWPYDFKLALRQGFPSRYHLGISCSILCRDCNLLTEVFLFSVFII